MKINRFVGDEGDEWTSPDWPWWTLVEALVWIVGEEGYTPPTDSIALNDGDLDWSAREWAAKELRIALAQGRVTAYGLRSHSEKPERIEPVEWASRHVPITEFVGVNSWQIEPYTEVVVAKDEIKRFWPVPLALAEEGPPSRRGRGRRRGSGSFHKADAPFVAEMHRLISVGDAASANEAAGMVLAMQIDGKTVRGASDDAKRDRLRRRYLAQFKR